MPKSQAVLKIVTAEQAPPKYSPSNGASKDSSDARTHGKLKFFAKVKSALSPTKTSLEIEIGVACPVNFRERNDLQSLGFYGSSYRSFENQVIIVENPTIDYTGTDFSKRKLRKAVNDAFTELAQALDADVPNPTKTETIIRPVVKDILKEIFLAIEEVRKHKASIKESLTSYEATVEAMVHLNHNGFNTRGDKPYYIRTISSSDIVTFLLLRRVTVGDIAMESAFNSDILKQMVKNPISGKKQSLADAIMRINDTEEVKGDPDFKPWTFDQIADWLETLDINITLCSREELENV